MVLDILMWFLNVFDIFVFFWIVFEVFEVILGFVNGFLTTWFHGFTCFYTVWHQEGEILILIDSLGGLDTKSRDFFAWEVAMSFHAFAALRDVDITHNEAMEPWERHGMTKAWYARYATISNWEITLLLPWDIAIYATGI